MPQCDGKWASLFSKHRTHINWSRQWYKIAWSQTKSPACVIFVNCMRSTRYELDFNIKSGDKLSRKIGNTSTLSGFDHTLQINQTWGENSSRHPLQVINLSACKLRHEVDTHQIFSLVNGLVWKCKTLISCHISLHGCKMLSDSRFDDNVIARHFTESKAGSSLHPHLSLFFPHTPQISARTCWNVVDVSLSPPSQTKLCCWFSQIIWSAVHMQTWEDLRNWFFNWNDVKQNSRVDWFSHVRLAKYTYGVCQH